MIPSQMLKGLLEGAILEVIKREETYAYEISKILEEFSFGEVSDEPQKKTAHCKR